MPARAEIARPNSDPQTTYQTKADPDYICDRASHTHWMKHLIQSGPAVKSEWGLSPGEESRITTVLKVCSYPRQMHLDGYLSSFLVPRDSFQAALAWIVMTGLGRKWLVALSPLPEDLNGDILLSEDIHLLTRGPKKTEDSETSSSSTLALFSPKLIRTTFLLWSVFFGSTFSYYGIVLPTSQRSSEERVAI
ncbi:hypothetical protein U1Q18_022699 [Sarracenia purpurea var. burkii]